MAPEGWTTMKLGEFCRVFSGGTPPRSNPAYYGGTIPWLKSGEVRNSCIEGTEETLTEAGLANSSTQWVEPNSTVIAMYGATAGAVGWLSIRATINQAIAAVIPNPEVADGRFIYHLLVSSSRVLLNFAQGSGQPNLNGGMVKGMSVLLPPLDEQRRIAAVLTAVDDAIQAAKAVMEQSAAALKATAEAQIKPLGNHIALLDVCRPKQWTTISKEEMVPSGVPVFGANGYIGFHSTANHDSDTLAITCRGNTCGSINWIPGPSYITGNSMCLDGIDHDQVLPRYLYHALKAVGVAQSISGSAQPQITRQSLGTVTVPLPDHAAQRRITEALDAIEAMIVQARQQVESIKTMKRGLLDDLLTGRVRVPDTHSKESIAHGS